MHSDSNTSLADAHQNGAPNHIEVRNLYSFLAIRHPNDILTIRRRLVVAGAVDVSRGIIRRSSPWQLASLFWCAKNG